MARRSTGIGRADPVVVDERHGRSATDHVYHSVRSGILHGDFRPNERLIEVTIADRLGTSRTPVREALQRLATEGLIVGGRQGWAVREFTAVEIREIFEVRGALEGLATELAAERATDEQRKVIEEVHQREQELTGRRGARREQVELNDEFHEAVLAASGNRRLIDACERNLAYYFNHPVAATLSDDEAAATIGEHTAVVQAILARDVESAGRAARAHVTRSLELVLGNLDPRR